MPQAPGLFCKTSGKDCLEPFVIMESTRNYVLNPPPYVLFVEGGRFDTQNWTNLCKAPEGMSETLDGD